MEQPSSSSKVTVEYFDPFNVYELLSPGLLARLPLRTLHWESHAGPLRSIKSLHVDLVPAPETQPPASASNPELSRVKSNESTASGDDGFRTQPLGNIIDDRGTEGARRGSLLSPAKGRRHQIPGLRQTPYLKVFLLRCDDADTYKSQARKQVREWVKAHTPPTQSSAKISAQENHDAFEYLILHVIVPNTAAATQPRISSKGSSTIYEKLRADFNGTSKAAVDRVAQIRIGINDVPYDRLPRVVPAIPGTYTESPEEHEASWQDLITKFKKLILDSFDMRVTQYEEDIREKDAQRSLPGWNFCTFFVLKEGLARGFESVGLVEDSLVGYDELAVGLDAIIRERAETGTGADIGGSFLPYTKDLLSEVEHARLKILQESGTELPKSESTIDLQKVDSAEKPDQDEILLSADRKSYRELILANNISIFDFKCYLFARQLALLLRMGNALSSREELLAKLKEQRETALLGVAARHPPAQPNEEGENLSILSEICRRSLDFLTTISRIMRDDLASSLLDASKREKTDEKMDISDPLSDPVTAQAIENVVSSFTFSVAQQILAQTATRALPIPPSALAPPKSAADGPDQEKATIPEPKTMMHPARSSSIISNPPERPVSPGVFPGGRRSFPASDQGVSSTFLKAGLEDLAAGRGQIYLLSRGVLERLGRQREWSVGWNPSESAKGEAGEMEDIDLESESKESGKELHKITPSIEGIDNPLLRTALGNQEDFYRLYEILTDKSLRHFSVAGHVQSAQASMADLALLRYQLHDYAGAASYLYRMTRFYGEAGWEEVQTSMLVMYTKCLKELKRNDEYVRAAITLLAKGAAQAEANFVRKSGFKIGHGGSLSNGDDISVDGYLTELMTVVPTLQHDLAVPLTYFFAGVEVEGGARYHDGRDGFSLQLKLRYLLLDDLHVNKAKARLVPVTGGQSRDIWLDLESAVDLKTGINRLQLQSNVTIPGTYVVKQVVLYSSKMTMSYESESSPPALTQNMNFFKCPRILLYQRADSFDITLSTSRDLHLDRQRSIEVSLSSGWNDIASGELHVRAATAGLRLQTGEAKLLDGDLDILKKSDPGVIRFGALPAGSSVNIALPFSLEHEASTVTLKIEISYTVGTETFFFANNPTLSVLLPLGVNVQDVFKQTALFSKFTISSATANPLRLLSSSLGDSDVFEARNGADLDDPVVIYPRQPASLLYRITRRATPLPPAGDGKKKQKSALQLKLHYICLEEEIDNAVRAALTTALHSTPLRPYARLLAPALLSALHARLTPAHLERAALLSSLSTAPLSGVPWSPHFAGLHADAPLLADWLAAFLAAHPHIPLPPPDRARASAISIAVAVPPVAVVHSASLRLAPATTDGPVTATTNQPLAATLELAHTRVWDAPGSALRGRELAFTYELAAPADAWLLGGRRKGGFVVPAESAEPGDGTGGGGKVLRFPVLLVPVKEGFLPLPTLEIRAVPGAEGEERVTSECEYRDGAVVVRVCGDAGKTTVSLDASGPQGGAWLLESVRRGE